jgi:hypothetical protein
MERKEACLYLLNLVSVINLELALSLADSLQLLSPCRGMILKPNGDQLQLYPLPDLIVLKYMFHLMKLINKFLSL